MGINLVTLGSLLWNYNSVAGRNVQHIEWRGGVGLCCVNFEKASGNRKDLKCVRCHRCLWSVVRGPCQLIPMYVHYYVNTVQYYFTR